MFTASKEILLHDLVLTATLTTIVTTTLLLGFKTRGPLDIGDFVDVLLFAGTTYRLLGFLHAFTGTTATTATGDGRIIILIAVTTTHFENLLVVVIRLLVCGTTATATRTSGLFRRFIIIDGCTVSGTITGHHLSDRRVGDVIVFKVLFNLFDLGGGTTLLCVQTTGPAAAARLITLTIGRFRSLAVMLLRIIGTSGIAVVAFVVAFGIIFAAGTGTTGTGTTGTTRLTLAGTVIAALAMVGIRVGRFIFRLGFLRGAGGQHRLLEQQRGHRLGAMARMVVPGHVPMLVGQQIQRILDAFFRGFRVADAMIARVRATCRDRLSRLVGYGDTRTTACPRRTG